MNAELERDYQQIGAIIRDLSADAAGRRLLYCEIEDGVVSADLFYVQSDGIVRYRACPMPTKAFLYEFWNKWRQLPVNREWRVLCFTLDGTSFSIDLTYPDQLNSAEDLMDRRPRAVRRYFGDVKVDYSKPRQGTT